MSQTVGGLSNPNAIDFNAFVNQLAGSAQAAGSTVVPGANETMNTLLAQVRNNLLPTLEAPVAADTSKAGDLTLGGLTLGGLSLETLLDAVGAEQRRTETKAGIANMEARAQERADANAEKVSQIQEEVNKAKSQGVLDTLLKAFKYVGMALAAIGAVTMLVAGGAAMAAGGAGAALIAVGIASIYLLADSITQEATGGKVGIGPGFAAGKLAEACGASDTAQQWIQFGVDLATSIALAVVGGLAAAGKIGGSAAKTVSDAAANVTQTVTKAATQTAKVTAESVKRIASIVARTATALSGLNTVAQSATTIVSAENEKQLSFLQAQQKRLDAILERIAQANDLDMDHIKAMMERSEAVMQQVSDIVQEGAATNTAILAGSPAMA